MSSKKGFSLIEVIVSVATIVGIVGTGSMLVRSYSTAVQANQSKIVAAGLAQELLSESYSSQRRKPEGPIEVTFDKGVKLINIRYTRELSINTVTDNSQKSQKYWQATAKVRWSDAGNDREVVLITDIARLGSK